MFTVIIRTLLPILTIFVTAAGGYWSVRLAWAEYLSTADSIAARKRATELAPGDAQNWIRLALLEQQNGLDASGAFTRAVSASPLDAEAWIGAGLERETSGDLAAAERNFLHAAEISRDYLPRWTLLNYYFRRNDPDHFWPWAKQALTLGAGDLQPIFRMAWSLSGNADQIERNAIPDRREVLSQYLNWLISAGKLDAAQTIWSRLLPLASEQELPSLQHYCNQQLDASHFSSASAAWNGLVSRHLLDAVQLPAAGGVVDGEFTREPLNFGFGWRVPVVEGVVVRALLPGLRVSFSGKQPETCEPVFQYILLEPKRTYRLEYEYFTSDIPENSGLAWRVFDAASGVEFTRDAPGLAQPRPARQSLTFTTPAGVSGGRLALSYRRSPGTTRVEGWLQLQRVALRLAE